MNRATALLVLLVCALLEAGGDALMRKGMHAGTTVARLCLYLTAAVALFAYGWLVNRPPWSFGSLLGVYVVLFFLVSQGIAFVAFGERPTAHSIIGGALIVGGGLVLAAR